MTAKRSTWTALAAGLLLGAWAPHASAEGDLAHGRSIFDLCQQCHGTAGEGNQLFLAPTIGGLDEWYVASQLHYFRSGARGMNPDDVGGLRMYPMSLSLKKDGDIEAVAAYVASLPRANPKPTLEGGDPQAGAQRYALCASCHGPKGAGNEAMKAPRLAGASDWYLLSTLQKFKSGVRGSDPGNPSGAVMRSFASQLDDQAMRDLVAYIGTFSGSE